MAGRTLPVAAAGFLLVADDHEGGDYGFEVGAGAEHGFLLGDKDRLTMLIKQGFGGETASRRGTLSGPTRPGACLFLPPGPTEKI
jgi:hypothetical protein